MKPTCYLLIFFMIFGSSKLLAQEVKSEKASIHVNNLPVPVEISDTAPPSLSIVTPDIRLNVKFYTNKEELDLIGKGIDENGISFISLNSEFQDITGSGIFTSRLHLEPGENRFKIVAMDNKDNLNEQFLIIEYTPPVVTLADKIANGSNYYGLIIGIDNYKDKEIPDLDNPVNDSQKLYDVLTTGYNFKKDNIRYLKNATRADIIQNLDELGKLISQGDNLLIFYAGHGWWDEEANNGYWLPSDAHYDQKTNWFRNSTLVDYLKEIDSKHTLLIADACFGGSIFKTRAAFGNSEKAYEKLYELPSRKAMTSGTLTEVPDRSSFTKYLIARLKENDELYLSSEQLFSSFRIAVINNSDAIPQYGEIGNVGDQGGDFIFLKQE